MRLEAQMKGGYYPAHPDAVAAVLEHVRLGDTKPEELTILDPCAGEGLAIGQIAQAWSVPAENVYAVELEEGRSERLRQQLLISNSLAPASFLGTSITHNSFSFVWCNPPFDDEIGGGARVELRFLGQATGMLRPKGLMAFVCPEDVAQSWDIRRLFSQRYLKPIVMMEFPAEHRKFEEVVVLARKAGAPPDNEQYMRYDEPEGVEYTLLPGRRPAKFVKSELTELELRRALAASPLRKLLRPPPELPLPRPPIPPTHGQSMMLLASGFIDGAIFPPDEPPHVVRGSCRKVEYVSNSEVRQSDDGKRETTVVTYSQRIVPVVRVLTSDGQIVTLSGGDEQ